MSLRWRPRSRFARDLGEVLSRPNVPPVVEPLEARRMMAGDESLVRALPYSLEFDAGLGGIVDRAGVGTGFSWVQPSPKLPAEYRPALIDLRPADGLLRLTSADATSAGGNWEADNTLVNALQSQFDASRAGGFTISTRVGGALGQIDVSSEQGGLLFGPDQDNYVKLVAIAQPGGPPVIQFIDETRDAAGKFSHTVAGPGSISQVAALADADALDLEIAGDPSSGKLTAYYRVDHGPARKLAQEITIRPADRAKFFGTGARAGIFVMNKNAAGPLTLPFERFEIVPGTPAVNQPGVTATSPAYGATNVPRDAAIDADLHLPRAGVDRDSLSPATVKLYRARDRAPVTVAVTTTGGRDSINLTPAGLLEANTAYTLEITAGVRDLSGNAFKPYRTTFTTGIAYTPADKDFAFSQTPLPESFGKQFTAVTMGPDGKLYAGTNDGLIYRYALRADGTIAGVQVINSLQTKGIRRTLTGLRFDPGATASNLILWVTHGQFAASADDAAADWTGKVTRLAGKYLETSQDYLTGLPRSVRDHMTNQLDFGPDGALYFSQSSNSAMGAADAVWGNRPEHLLNAAILRLDTKALAVRIAAGKGPLNVKTADGGNYDPFRPDAPLTLYATGVRNAYDLLWHSNGKLYVPANGSAAGANTPASGNFGRRIDAGGRPYMGPTVMGMTGVPQTMDDYLFNIAPGGYYGHPNPARGEFVLNGGNPTAGVDPFEVTSYRVGTMPDANYRRPAYSFGRKQSPNGIVEYRSGVNGTAKAFGGKLEGKLIVARFSAGDDLMILGLDAKGNVIDRPATRVEGFGGFDDPLDVAVDARNGFLYVTQYAETEPQMARIVLLKPKAAA